MRVARPRTALALPPVKLAGRMAGLPLILALCLPGALQAAETALTLARAQHIAVERSQQLVAQDAAISASREMAVAAGQLPDPVIRLGVDNLPADGPDQFSTTRDFMTMRRIGVMQEITGSGKRRFRAARFEREAEQAYAEKAAATVAIQRDTALAWLDRYYAEAVAATVADQIRESRLEIEAADAAYRAGRGSQADVFAARSTLAALEDRASESGRRIRTATAVLARWLGNGADAPLAGRPALDTVPLVAGKLDAQLEHHPQIAVLGKQADVATADAQLAHANKQSDWSVEVAYQQRGSAYSNMISFGVSIPLQWDQKNRQGRELAAKLAAAERIRAQREDALRARTAEARAMLHEWENGRERLGRYARELIPLAQDRTRAAIAAYRGGKTSLSDALAARRNEIEVRLQALQIEADTARWWAQLNFLIPEDAAARVTTAARTPRNATKELP